MLHSTNLSVWAEMETGECTESRSGYFWLAAGAVCNPRGWAWDAWWWLLTNRHGTASSHGESLALRNRKCLSVGEAEACTSNSQGGSKNSSKWLPTPQICSYWAALTSWRNVSLVMMWFHCIRHLVLEMPMMCCSSVVNYVKFLDGGCVGTAGPMRSTERRSSHCQRQEHWWYHSSFYWEPGVTPSSLQSAFDADAKLQRRPSSLFVEEAHLCWRDVPDPNATVGSSMILGPSGLIHRHMHE